MCSLESATVTGKSFGKWSSKSMKPEVKTLPIILSLLERKGFEVAIEAEQQFKEAGSSTSMQKGCDHG